MMTIKEMSELSGVSARTLRYYDEIVYSIRLERVMPDIGFMMKLHWKHFAVSFISGRWIYRLTR